MNTLQYGSRRMKEEKEITKSRQRELDRNKKNKYYQNQNGRTHNFSCAYVREMTTKCTRGFSMISKLEIHSHWKPAALYSKKLSLTA